MRGWSLAAAGVCLTFGAIAQPLAQDTMLPPTRQYAPVAREPLQPPGQPVRPPQDAGQTPYTQTPAPAAPGQQPPTPGGATPEPNAAAPNGGSREPGPGEAQPEPPPNPWLPQGAARLQVLDKPNAQSTTLTVKVGQSATYGSLTIAVQACVIRPPDMPQDAAAFLVITDQHTDQPGFRGWMVKSDPSLQMLEHPIYDVRVLGCAQ